MYKMPYKIVRTGSGFKVCSDKQCHSKQPLALNVARRQRIALALSESRKTGKPASAYFA